MIAAVNDAMVEIVSTTKVWLPSRLTRDDLLGGGIVPDISQAQWLYSSFLSKKNGPSQTYKCFKQQNPSEILFQQSQTVHRKYKVNVWRGVRKEYS